MLCSYAYWIRWMPEYFQWWWRRKLESPRKKNRKVIAHRSGKLTTWLLSASPTSDNPAFKLFMCLHPLTFPFAVDVKPLLSFLGLWRRFSFQASFSSCCEFPFFSEAGTSRVSDKYVVVSSYPITWPILIPYLIWINLIDNAPNEGGRISVKFRKNCYFEWFAGYFPVSMIKVTPKCRLPCLFT
jgi:hypothetical protein